MGSRRIYK